MENTLVYASSVESTSQNTLLEPINQVAESKLQNTLPELRRSRRINLSQDLKYNTSNMFSGSTQSLTPFSTNNMAPINQVGASDMYTSIRGQPQNKQPKQQNLNDIMKKFNLSKDTLKYVEDYSSQNNKLQDVKTLLTKIKICAVGDITVILDKTDLYLRSEINNLYYKSEKADEQQNLKNAYETRLEYRKQQVNNTKIYNHKYQRDKLLKILDVLYNKYSRLNHIKCLEQVFDDTKTEISTSFEDYCKVLTEYKHVQEVEKNLHDFLKFYDKIQSCVNVKDNQKLQKDIDILHDSISCFLDNVVVHLKINEIKLKLTKSAQNFNHYNSLTKTITSSLHLNMCGICCSNKLDSVLIPCGHTACNTCLTKLIDGNCCYCRTKFNKIQKIFYT